MTNQPQTQITDEQVEQEAKKTNEAQRCSSCKWTNVGLLNVGWFGNPKWICHSCITIAIKELSTIRAELAQANTLVEMGFQERNNLRAANTKLRAALKRMEQIYEQIKENI